MFSHRFPLWFCPLMRSLCYRLSLFSRCLGPGDSKLIPRELVVQCFPPSVVLLKLRCFAVVHSQQAIILSSILFLFFYRGLTRRISDAKVLPRSTWVRKGNAFFTSPTRLVVKDTNAAGSRQGKSRTWRLDSEFCATETDGGYHIDCSDFGDRM